MEARRGILQTPQVQLKQKFWLTEDSMAKLLMAGAKYVDGVAQENHYYDTASDDLAMAGLWLSRRDQEWFLIVEAQEGGTQEKLEEQVKEKAADPEETLCQKTANNVQQDNAPACGKPSRQNLDELRALLKIQDQQLDSEAADLQSERPKVSSTFTELVGESEVAAYLAAHLRLDLTTAGREKATMEDFLQKAGIEHYASNHIVDRATFLLSDRYTVIVQREESSSRETVTVVLEADVFNVCKGLEEIEKLAAYLGLEQQGVQSEGEIMT
ncbi:uncharacterized protein LOC113443984 [Pseudonaja textilis]|uniref:uncharacterized protein LOC113443984 n=1 Tax=Pseudonaja textilis TaxID=8673 RepID=UPI000EA99C9D|nr:uncharacterized protein LOC113443984 [Pseudonaja textilis]